MKLLDRIKLRIDQSRAWGSIALEVGCALLSDAACSGDCDTTAHQRPAEPPKPESRRGCATIITARGERIEL